MNLTTELSAINTALRMAGLPPVNTLSGDSEVVTIQGLLEDQSRKYQAKGWYWNTADIQLTPDVDGVIQLPANTLRADPKYLHQNHLVQRGLRLWDSKHLTDNIGAPVWVTLTQFLDFDEVPEAFRHFVTVRVGQIFQQNFVGSDSLDRFNVEQVNEAWVDLQADDTERSDYNFFNNEDGRNQLDRDIREQY